MSTDTKALIAATPATVALVRRELDKSRESQRGMQCSIPKAVKVDCAMVERLCRIAEKQADRLAELEEQLRLANIDALQTEAERAALEAENQRLRAEVRDVLANLDAPDDMDVISAAHFVAGSLHTAEEALEAAQAEARELRAELARVWEDRNRYLHAARCAYGLLWQELADTERVREARRLLLEALPDEERKCGIHYAMQRAGLTEAEIVAALSQAAEQHDPLAVSDHCPECSEPEPECVCGEQPAERESPPLTPAPQPEEAEP